MDSASYKTLAIKAGADPESLVRRPLTWEEWTGMNEAARNWHLQENSKAVDAVYEAHSKDVSKAEVARREKVAKLYRNESETNEVDTQNAVHNFQGFIAKYPQYINLPVQAATIFEWLRVHSMFPEVEHIITAFEVLAREGKIKIDGSATGLVDDAELKGEALASHPQLDLLLQPVTAATALHRRVWRMNDAEFKKWDQEQHGSKELPLIIKQRIEKACTTLLANHPELQINLNDNREKLLSYINERCQTVDAKNLEMAFQALKAAGELDLNENVIVQTERGATWIGYEQIEGATLTEKQETLRRKINKMTEPEYREWLQTPANRRAVDNLP